MLFNSTTFVAFFITVYLAYLVTARSHIVQNRILLVASYVFYGTWDWRFLSLLFVSTGVDYFVGKAIDVQSDERKRKLLLAISLLTNLSILGFFKYFSFFVDSFADLLSVIGMTADQPTLKIILPVGISFYTFQTLSYTIDIYRRRLRPTNDFLSFALFVAFFPQLVAGPIERARNLLPQIVRRRDITGAMIDAGIFLILWGFFKKVVIADNVGLISDQVFGNYVQFHGFDVLVGVLAFTIQIYCDFSGYSDIARGICKLMGFDLMVNFRLPYFALNPSDFWTRWHISLSSWLRDYLYIPLGGNRHGDFKTFRNLVLTMLLGGLWHGAAWNFVIWGAYHGGLLALYRVLDRNPEHLEPWSARYSRSRVICKICLMFGFTVIGWLIFRAESMHQVGSMLASLFHVTSEIWLTNAYELFYLSLPLVAIQIWQYVSGDLLIVTKQRIWTRGAIYGGMFYGIIVFGVRDSMEFIYFQF